MKPEALQFVSGGGRTPRRRCANVLTCLPRNDSAMHLSPHLVRVAWSDWTALSGLWREVPLEAGQVLCQPRGDPQACWLLASAVTARMAVDEQGHARETGVNGPGSLACAFAALALGCAPWRVEVRRGGVAYRLDLSDDALARAPGFATAAGAMAQDELLQLAAQFAARSFQCARGFVAQRLAELFEALDSPVIEVTHQDLAEWYLLRRATVTVALQDLEGLRAIRSTRGRIELRDAEILRHAGVG